MGGAGRELFGPAWSPLCWKSRCWSACLGSTCPCVGFEPSRFSALVGAAVLDGVVEEPAAAEGTDDVVSVFGDGAFDSLRSQPAAKASDTAAIRVSSLIVCSGQRVCRACKLDARCTIMRWTRSS